MPDSTHSSINKKGFTLIELLVVISIIAILAVIAIASYQIISKNARDSKRLSDLRQIQGALEQYYSDQLVYPPIYWNTLPADTVCSNIPPGTLVPDCPFTSPDKSKVYMNKVPDDANYDPNNPYTTRYYYISSTSKAGQVDCIYDPSTTSQPHCVSYCLYAHMENTDIYDSSNPNNPQHAGNNTNCTDASGTFNFYVTVP